MSMLPVTEVRMTREWPPADSRWMLPAERPVLAELVTAIGAKTVVEIGVNEGVTARYLLDTCPSITRYIGIEVPLHYRPAFTDQIKEVPLVPGVLVRNGHSRFALMVRQRGSLDVTVDELPITDLFLVDGDHGRDAVLHDAGLARAVIRPGGAILYHDYKRTDDRGRPTNVNVADVLEEMAANGAPLKHIAGTWLAIEMKHG
jgi:predicted O-methyltransferase YrrM